ncbi:MAG: hypothetical protein U9R39_03595 [Campylobacterota bacterium]|nr:hypothetical protein [Campylobacterota bacterium]
MIIQLEKSSLFSTFNVDSFSSLDSCTQVMAPSMVEYYLSDLASSSDFAESYINKSNIQQTIFLEEYSLYLDYNDDIYLEFTLKDETYETQSLW